jgi:hypothetical protein
VKDGVQACVYVLGQLGWLFPKLFHNNFSTKEILILLFQVFNSERGHLKDNCLCAAYRIISKQFVFFVFIASELYGK